MEGDRLIGLAPMLLRWYWYRGIPLRKIEFIGHSPVNGFLVSESREEVTRAFLHRLCGPGRGRPWDLIELARVAEDGADLQLMRETIRNLRLKPYEIEDHPNGICMVEDWEAYTSRRSKNFLKSLRGRENRLRSLGNLSLLRYSGFEDRYEEPESRQKLETVFLKAIECARHSWQGHTREGNAISDANAHRFFREIIHSFASRNRLLFHVLASGDIPISFDLSFLDGQRVTDYKAGFHEGFGYYSPGAHMFKTMFEYASSKGIPCVDLMSIERGQEYKYRYVDEIHRTRRILVFNRTVNGSLARFVMKGVVPKVKRLVYRAPGPS
jgi:hypothetical protein